MVCSGRSGMKGSVPNRPSSSREHSCRDRFPQFLTGTASQTESDVTPTKQMTGEFLTRARTALCRLAARSLLRLHRDNMAGSQCRNFLQLTSLRSWRLYGAADKPRSLWRI